MKPKITLLSIFIVFLWSCMPTNLFIKLTSEEQIYLGKVMAQPLTFIVDVKDSELKWVLAQSFIAKYSSMKIETITNYLLETYNPYQTRFGYKVIRTPLEEGDEFCISCLYDNPFSKNDAYQNAHILAYYLVTNEITIRLISR